MNNPHGCIVPGRLPFAGVLLMLGITGCVEQKYQPLVGAPDGKAEMLAVESEGGQDLEHAKGPFLELVHQPGRVVVVDFWGPHCGPCLHLAPELREIARMYPDRVSVVKVDVESSDNIELAQYFEIHAIPEIRVFVDGQSVGAIHGFATAERIAQNLEPAMALLDRNSGS